MQMRNNNAGVRFIVRYMFEITQMGAVLPSYDMETLIDDEANTDTMRLWMSISLGLTLWFCFLEGVELTRGGPVEYFTNLWNVLDWTNFAVFALTYTTLSSTMTLNARDKQVVTAADCPTAICAQFGFYDLWEVFAVSRDAKFYMSICVCIQLLKIIKFTNVIVPKMSLMTRVLSKGCYDLIFFGIIFGVSMFAFCMLFYIQLGSFMDDFYSQTSSMIALFKALFGDFLFDEIVDNSRGYLNGILFLVYLFVAVFVLLSMFLAILGEAQAAVRDDENRQKEEGTFPNQYGVLGEAREQLGDYWAKMRRKRGKGASEEEEAAEDAQPHNENPQLDAALSGALQRMQKKLDRAVQDRVTSLEQRLLRQLATLNGAIANGVPIAKDVTISREPSSNRRASKADASSAAKLGSSRAAERRGASISPEHRRGNPGEGPGRMTAADYDREAKAALARRGGVGPAPSAPEAHDERARSRAVAREEGGGKEARRRDGGSASCKPRDGDSRGGARRASLKNSIAISPTASPGCERHGGTNDERSNGPSGSVRRTASQDRGGASGGASSLTC